MNSQNYRIKENTTEACKYLVMIAWGLNIVISASLTLVKVTQKIKKWLLIHKPKVLPIFEENATRAFGISRNLKKKVTPLTWENNKELFTKPFYK